MTALETALGGERPGVDPHPRPQFGVNVIAYASSNVGMGIAARHYIRLLLERGVAVAILDVGLDYKQDSRTSTYDHLAVPHARDLPHEINLIMLNISKLPEFFLNPPDGLFRNDRMNVGLTWWELTVLPDRWIEALRLFDVVLAGSDFVRHVVEINVPGARVVRAKHPVYLPADSIIPDRARFGLPAQPVLFLTSFEPLSGVQRKNSFAAVVAFKRAFPDTSDLRANLVVKLNNVGDPNNVEMQHFLGLLHEECAGDPRIRVLTESLSYSDVLQLYASCDVVVSLHRSEGLGLAPLEAMRLGRPAIATAWSGNLTYMNYSNSCLVSYGFVTAGGDSHYTAKFLGRNGYWADPDLGEAALWMRSLVDTPELRASFAERAYASATAYQEDAERASFLDELLAIWRRFDSSAQRYRHTEALRTAVRSFDQSLITPQMRLAEAKKRISENTRRFSKRTRAALDRHLLWRFK